MKVDIIKAFNEFAKIGYNSEYGQRCPKKERI